MVNQVTSGKAFEYTLASAACKKLENRIEFVKDQAYNNTKSSFEQLNSDEQSDYKLASSLAIDHIIHLEPYLNDIENNLMMQIQSDPMGQTGDVRDIVLYSKDWEIGISAKIENDAVKHSRLSDTIDFGKDWFQTPCSTRYMNRTKEIFAPIRKMMADNNIVNWNTLTDKKSAYYRPLLEAFDVEIRSLVKENHNVPTKLVEYLIGKNDFYKVMKYSKCLEIQGYNLGGTLGKPSDKLKCPVSKLHFPTEIIKTSIIGDNKLSIVLDRGWSLTLRIHNARKKIEPSLKFDIRLVGIPDDMYNSRIHW